MSQSLEEARRLVEANKTLAGFSVHLQGEELHLAEGDVSFARLIPVDGDDRWRIEYFHNEKRWERIDFTGSLAACLELLGDSPHYLFWDG
jgi:hypothetical protein